MILSCPSCGARFRTGAQTLGETGRKVRCAKCKHVWHATRDQAEREDGEPAPDHDIETGPGARETSAESPGSDGSDFAAMAREALGARGQTEQDGGTPSRASEQPLTPDQDEMEAHRQARRDALRRRAMEEMDEPPRRGRRGWLGWGLFVLVLVALAAAGWFGRFEIVSRIPAAAQVYSLAGVSIDPVAPGLELRNASRRRQLTDSGSILVLEGDVVNVSHSTKPVPLLQIVLFDAGGNELTAWTFAAEVSSLEAGETTVFQTQIEDPPEAARELSLTFTPAR